MPLPSLTKAIKIFFSYDTLAIKDRRLFEKLTKHLSILQRLQLIHEWYDSAISAGKDINQFIETHMSEADIIVLLISADFIASERCYKQEMQRALELSATGNTRLIPVLLRPIIWEDLPLSKYKPLPPDGKPVTRWGDIDNALIAVVHGIRKVIDEITNQTLRKRPHPTPAKSSLYHVPYRYNAFFADRDTILALLSSSFTTKQTSQTPILALNGPPGIGKTQIALTYLHRSEKQYQTILWLNASSSEVLTTEVNSLADRLSLPEDEREDEQHLFSAFKQWLQDQETTWLLVLDQIDDVTLVDLIVPSQSKGHVLLTTRMQATGNFAFPISIAAMAIEHSVEFLLHRAGIIQPGASLNQAPAEIVQQATAIAHEMDSFPLALDQAGAYLEETGCDLITYASLFQQERTTLLGQRGRLANHHPDSVLVTLSLAFAQVSQKHAENMDLLRLLAFLHPDTIPDQLLVQGATELNEPLQSLASHPLTLHERLAELLSFSLIYRSTDTTTLRIHRIIQTVLIDTLTPEQQYYQASQVVRLVNHVFPDVDFENWNACERYLPQAQHCAKLIDQFQLSLKEAPLLLERTGFYCYQRGCYDEAEMYLTQALDLHERLLTANSIDAAQALNALALLYHRQARSQESEALHQRALELREHILGPDHPSTAESLHNLAVLYGSQAKYQHAEQLYQRVLTIDERTLGSEHPETAKTLNNLGLMAYLQGNYSQAEIAYQRALTIYERILSSNDPDLTYTLNSLGTLYEKLGNYPPALELYRRALTIREETLGDDHPETAHSINKLADIHESMGNDQQAEVLYQRALTIGEQALDPDHPDIALFLNNLAFLANKQGQYEQAEQFYQRALTIYEQALGSEHPTIARVLNNLGQLSRNTQNEERAEMFFRRAFAIRQQVLGPTHPDTAQSMSNLANLLSDQHTYQEAKALFQQALAILVPAFGPDHPTVVLIQEQYATLLKRMM